jgi:hypothetical protein
MPALAIRGDIGSEELRRRARRERDGRVSARLIAIANAWKAWIELAQRGWPEWIARPCVTGFIATMRKGSLGCAIGQGRGASRS